MAQVAGQRTTNQARTEVVEVRRVDDRISLLEPNEAPLVTFFNRMKRRRAIDQTKREWIEDDYNARWDQANGAVANTTASTTVTVDDGTKFGVGDLVVVPKSSSATTVPEVIRVTAVSGHVLTVVRGVGGAGVDTIADNAPLRIIGNAKEEGAAIGAMKSTTKVTLYNYTQIFETVIDHSKTQAAIRQYGTPEGEREYQIAKALKEHKIKMAAAMLWGQRSEGMTAGPNSKPLRTMGGLNSFISTNIYDASGTLNRKAFEAFARQAFRYGKAEKILLASPLIISAINEWGHQFLQVKPGETKLGVKIQEVETGHGTFVLVKDWMLEDGVAGSNGFGHCAFALDMDQLEYNYLSNNGENRDTHLVRNVVKDGRDAYVDQILTECTMKVGQEKYHAKLINVTDYMGG